MTRHGLEIVQKYVKLDKKRVSTSIYKERTQITIAFKTDFINSRKQSTAFMPNFMDASTFSLFMSGDPSTSQYG